MTKQNKVILGVLGASVALVTIGILLSKKDKNLSDKLADKGLQIVNGITDLINKGKKKAEALHA